MPLVQMIMNLTTLDRNAQTKNNPIHQVSAPLSLHEPVMSLHIPRRHVDCRLPACWKPGRQLVLQVPPGLVSLQLGAVAFSGASGPGAAHPAMKHMQV
jgi:hypothetical protein